MKNKQTKTSKAKSEAEYGQQLVEALLAKKNITSELKQKVGV